MTDPMDFRIPGVREYQWQWMREYVRDCADIFGLRDWTILYYYTPPEGMQQEGLQAGISTTTERSSFTIWLPPEWFDKCNPDATREDREEARQTLAHELLHVHYEPIDHLMTVMQTNVGDHVWGVWHDMYMHAMEQQVDRMAQFAAKALPMPYCPEAPEENAAPVAFLSPDDV